MRSALESVNGKIKYYRTREARFEAELRTEEDLKAAEMRLEHTREMLGELIHIRQKMLAEKGES